MYASARAASTCHVCKWLSDALPPPPPPEMPHWQRLANPRTPLPLQLAQGKASASAGSSVAALELVAMDMKAQGMFVCRTLSFAGARGLTLQRGWGRRLCRRGRGGRAADCDAAGGVAGVQQLLLRYTRCRAAARTDRRSVPAASTTSFSQAPSLRLWRLPWRQPWRGSTPRRRPSGTSCCASSWPPRR